MKRRFFLWAYSNIDNYEVSRNMNLLGFPKGNDASYSKACDLARGDIVLIRDSRSKDPLLFFGSCVIENEPYEVKNNNLIWPDEIISGEVVYPFRVKVDFSSSPFAKLHEVDWADFLNLRWRNKKGKLMDRKALMVFFSKGNFVDGYRAEELYGMLTY